LILKEHSLEMRGMPHRDLEEYFFSIGGKHVGQGTYMFTDWNVDLGDEYYVTLGSLRIPTTKVTFRVDEERWPKIVNAFRLRFLSAGG